MMTDSTIAFIGLGLIGGPIPRGIKRALPEIPLMPYPRTRSRLEQAKADGIVDVILDGIGEELRQCDLIFLCTPVEYNAQYLSSIRPYLKPGALLTDVGSTKTDIHEAVTRLGMEQVFVGGHPMAGSEKTGYENSTDHLLENAYYIITPTARSTPEQIDRIREVALAIGALPLVLDYHEHDFSVAAISHLPHLVASSLVNLVHDNDSKDEIMKRLAAGGFKDITRIASSSPVVWEQISLSNKKNIKELLQKAQNHLGYVIAALDMEDREYLNNYFKQAGEYRDSVPDSAVGLIQKSYEIFIDIPDEPGTIATTTTLLALNHVSIKNIGIIHNREFEEGVLKIMLYDDESAKKATKILRDKNYTVYERK